MLRSVLTSIRPFIKPYRYSIYYRDKGFDIVFPATANYPFFYVSVSLIVDTLGLQQDFFKLTYGTENSFADAYADYKHEIIDFIKESIIFGTQSHNCN